MRTVHTTGAGQLTDHHQADLQAPARAVSGATSQLPKHHASSCVRSPQCELPLSATPSARPPVRSRAARVASFMSHFFDNDPATRALLEATARAEERRSRKRTNYRGRP
jgi:hypothetical protein